jgi:hypothetical protein
MKANQILRPTEIGTDRHLQDSSMDSIDEKPLPAELRKQLEEPTRAALSSVRDPCDEAACDRMREQTLRKHGVLDIGAPAIRELRDGS